jgi:hypothetical protein
MQVDIGKAITRTMLHLFLGPNRPPLLVFNTCPCILVELGEPKAPAYFENNRSQELFCSRRTQFDANI